tara:strand:- start:786 stop:1010 length:225 start_codon:yes stop_codon:yes gene_type:complete
MFSQFKKIILSFLINGFLLLSLILIIQNSNTKNKVNLLIIETIDLPLSFILGVSFISGSLLGSLLPINSPKIKR